jgi:RNA polymerase sigma-70 factor (ECF subfamily)
MTGADDATLVTRAKSGDREAFGELVARHQRAMYAVSRAYFASEADADDAVQDAFVKAFQALDQLNSGSRFAAWMARITMNTCLDVLRARTDKQSLADFATSVPVRPRLGQPRLTPATLASRAEESELVRAAIGRLPEHQRVAIMLRYGGQLTYEQIADYLGVPVSTVDGRLYKAKRALRKMLGPLDSPGA